MTFIPTPKQSEALKMLAEKLDDGCTPRYKYFLLAGGSRSGKTAICCYNLIVRAYSKPSRHVILRYHFNDVKTSVGMDTLPKMLKLLGLRYELNKTDWYFTIPCQYGGVSEIWLTGTDSEERTDKVLGKEFSTIYFNECSQISYHSYTTALTRLAENSGLNNRVLIDLNPVGKNHYIYKMFVLGQKPTSQETLPNKDYYGSISMNPTDNPHLPDDYISSVLETLPERQKQRFLYGQWQDARIGALFNYEQIERARVSAAPQFLPRMVVAIDPAVTSNEQSDETGIVIVGMDSTGDCYVVADVSGKYSPSEWSARVRDVCEKFQIDTVVYESNQGGDMVSHTIKTANPNLVCQGVRATRGKALRAEPVVALYEQGKVHHVGVLPELEEQLTEWTPEDSDSPDRLDALVWGITFLVESKCTYGAHQPNSPVSHNRSGYTPMSISGGYTARSPPPMFGSGAGYRSNGRQRFGF